MVQFAYNNSDVINLLYQRANYIRGGKLDQVQQINQKMIDMFSADAADSRNATDKVQTPVTCFISFQKEEGYNRAVCYNDVAQIDPSKELRTLLEEPVHVEPAPEPSDIIWENRQYSRKERIQRSKKVFLILFIVLLVSFILIFQSSTKMQQLIERYPEQDCHKIQKLYDSKPGKFWHESLIEYESNKDKDDENQVLIFDGPLQCFCQSTEFDKINQLSLKDEKKLSLVDACEQLSGDKELQNYLSLLITVIIVVINEVLTVMIFSLVQTIKLANKSSEASIIFKLLFISYFFNTGVIILMINMTLHEHKPAATVFNNMFTGRYSDYSPQWYTDVGYQIYQTYFVQMFMPWVWLLIEVVQNTINKGVDTGFTFNILKTRSKNIHSFLNLYTGADFSIDLSLLYAADWNIIFLAMFYGVGIPIMFPMAIVILVN